MSLSAEDEYDAPYSPRVVQLKKVKGTIVQDCDIYIGNEIRNSSWELKESKWQNPYHGRWDLLPTQRLEKYKLYVLNNPYLMKCLTELRGQHLGCLCKNEEYCHGNVLKDLVSAKFKNDFFLK